jgi:hypothetical protein
MIILVKAYKWMLKPMHNKLRPICKQLIDSLLGVVIIVSRINSNKKEKSHYYEHHIHNCPNLLILKEKYL